MLNENNKKFIYNTTNGKLQRRYIFIFLNKVFLILLLIVHVPLSFFNVPLLYFIILPFMEKLPHMRQLVVPQKCSQQQCCHQTG